MMKRFFDFLYTSLPYWVLALLVIVPLYPKKPLIDVSNTWVYIRVEDFLVFIVLGIWTLLLLKKQVTLKSPLTIPILAYWLVGAITTIHAIVLIFPSLANVFPNVAFLAYVRHIEYVGVFFVAYSAVRDQKFLTKTIWTIIIVLLCVVGYGFGQKYLSFPAFLTMNEEYAKGIPIVLSELSRIPSTFAGHYDLAAYLVLIIPLLASLFFGFKNPLMKAVLVISCVLGVLLLFMTVSRVSFFVLFIGLFFTVYFHHKKLALASIPVVLILGVTFLSLRPQLMDRFGSTIKEVDVLVDAQSGSPLGQVQFEDASYLNDKLLTLDKNGIAPYASISATIWPTYGKNQLEMPYIIPDKIAVVRSEIISNGETLPQGSEYINLPLSPVTSRLTAYVLEAKQERADDVKKVTMIPGTYLVKRASAYDISFTTRFQGEWPNTFKAFTRNVFFGSGYSSVSLAVDNNYLRILGETGLLGMLSFLALFAAFLLYAKKMLPDVESPVARSFVFGLIAGIIGLSLNAVLIDVFEASKVAFQLWTLVGIAAGVLTLSAKKNFHIYEELKRLAISPYAIAVYLMLFLVVFYLPILAYYFVGDDFTWFRWVADCQRMIGEVCSSKLGASIHYLTNSDGFFYRPGTKIYFMFMYPLFWLNQSIYHLVSIILHGLVILLLYMLSRRIFRDNLLSGLAIAMYIAMSGYLESIVWISSTGYLFTAVFLLSGLHLFILWKEKNNILYLLISFILALIATFFHELGIVAPVLYIGYLLFDKSVSKENITALFKNKLLYLIFLQPVVYLLLRFSANSYWFAGDYSYNILKLPFNTIGNAFGYLLISILGPGGMGIYEKLRMILRDNILISLVLSVIFVVGMYYLYKNIHKFITNDEKRVVHLGILFFIVTLLPFLGLGNIASRYSYLSSFGVCILLVIGLKKVYEQVLNSGKDIAGLVTAIFLFVFILFHLIQVQQGFADWNGSGIRVKNLITSLEASYNDTWSTMPVKLYFIDVPVKVNTAWVFPVGLEDAVWFGFRNPSLDIRRVTDINQIPLEEQYDRQTWIFKVQDDGTAKRFLRKKPVVVQQ